MTFQSNSKRKLRPPSFYHKSFILLIEISSKIRPQNAIKYHLTCCYLKDFAYFLEQEAQLPLIFTNDDACVYDALFSIIFILPNGGVYVSSHGFKEFQVLKLICFFSGVNVCDEVVFPNRFSLI